MIHNNYYIVYTLHDAGFGTCGLYTRWTICRLQLVQNDYRTWELLTKIYDLHVTSVITWRLYHLHNFKLWAWYNTLPNHDCEPGVLHCQNHWLRLCFLTSFVYVWISFLHISADIAFWVSLQDYNWIVVAAFLNCEFEWRRRSPTAAWNLQFGLWSSTWTHTFICRDRQVFTTTKLLLNNVLCHTVI